MFKFFWFCLTIVLVVVVVLLEVKFWKRQSPVRRMMLSIKRESAKLFQQNKVSSYKISIIWMALDAPEFHVKRLEIWPRIDRLIWPIKVFFCRGERDTKIVWLNYWPSFPSISSCAKFTIIKWLGCRFMNTETRVQRIIQHLVSLFFRDQALPDINNVEKVAISLDKGCWFM